MASIVAGMASSHAFTLVDPGTWDRRRERNQDGYRHRYGADPPVLPAVREKVAAETLVVRRERYRRIRNGLDGLRDAAERKRLDAIVVIGDDQDENFTEANLPQIAIYQGAEFYTTERGESGRRRGARYRCHSELAGHLLHGLVEREFDVASCGSFPNDELLSHAHGPILQTVTPEARVPVVLVFVNAIHLPAISPGRCYRLGQAIHGIVCAGGSAERVALYASGGLSHFTAGYPWPHYRGPHSYGSISEEFDRRLLEHMREGRGGKLAELTSEDLLEHGAVEFRSWITVLGALGDARPETLCYEPLYSALMGMGVAYWDLE